MEHQSCSICQKTCHNKSNCPVPKFWNDICHSTNTNSNNLKDAYSTGVKHPDIWKTDPESQFPVIIHNDSNQYFDIYWLIDPVPNNHQSDHRLQTKSPKNWRIKHRNIVSDMKLIIPVGCIGHVFGFFQKCETRSDIATSRIIRIRDWNIGKKITFDGDKIYAEHEGWKITNLPLLVRFSDPFKFVHLKYMSKV